MRPGIVDNTLELLERELPKYCSEIKRVQLCFTTDPFMVGYPEIEEMSLKAIELINSYEIPCVVLTKGALPASLAQLSTDNCYGITLVSLSEAFRREMEPNTTPYEDRINRLRALHDAGCRTWVSMEPYPTPNFCNQNLATILEKVGFVDRIVFGRTHYDRRTSSYGEAREFYRKAANQVRVFCVERDIDCHIKRGTAD